MGRFKGAAFRAAVATLSLVIFVTAGWLVWQQQHTTEALRRQLADTETQLNILSQQTSDHFNNLASRLENMSKGVKTEIAVSRRQAHGDLALVGGGLSQRLDEVARNGNGLSGRLDEVARVNGGLSQKLEDVAREGGGLSQRLDEVARVGGGLSDRLGAVEREGGHLVDRVDQVSKQIGDLAQAGAAPTLVASAPASPSEMQPSAAQTDMATVLQIRAGHEQFDARRYDESRKTFQAVLAVRPDNTDARLYLAVSLFRSSPSDATHYPQVERDLRSVLSGDGSNILALETLSLVQVQRERWTDARDLLQKLLVLEPDNPMVIKIAGFCAVKLDDLAAARDYYARAVKLQPDDREALSALGDCEYGLGNAAGAERAWKAGLTSVDSRSGSGAREGAALSIKLARSAGGRGGWDDCLAYARSGLQMGQSPLLRAYEGLSLVKLGKSSEGRSILTQMAKSDDAQASDLASRALQEPSP